jgi:hypothetical protein
MPLHGNGAQLELQADVFFCIQPQTAQKKKNPTTEFWLQFIEIFLSYRYVHY